jgi:hypothetical protein
VAISGETKICNILNFHCQGYGYRINFLKLFLGAKIAVVYTSGQDPDPSPSVFEPDFGKVFLGAGRPGPHTQDLKFCFTLFFLQDIRQVQLQNIKDKLRHFFEYGDGAQCNITSLFFCEKSPGTPGTLGMGEKERNIINS